MINGREQLGPERGISEYEEYNRSGDKGGGMTGQKVANG